jgi:hypothetical protein
VLDDAGARAFADSIGFDEWPASRFEKTLAGQVTCWRRGDRWLIRAIVRDDLPSEARATFEDWARHHVYVVVHTNNPAADGWFRRRSDDGWQVTARAGEMRT